MNNNIATNYDIVEQKIKGTEASRNEMISALSKLAQTINSTSDWKGVDADKHKAALLDFCQKLTNCARWMEAAGAQALQHSNKLKERALASQRTAKTFE